MTPATDRPVRPRGRMLLETPARRINIKSVFATVILLTIAWSVVFFLWSVSTLEAFHSVHQQQLFAGNAAATRRHRDRLRLADPTTDARGRTDTDAASGRTTTEAKARLTKRYPSAIIWRRNSLPGSTTVEHINLHQADGRVHFEEDGDIYSRPLLLNDEEEESDEDDEQSCVQMHDWMSSTFPSCAIMHEIDMTNRLTPVTQGTIRMVWRFVDFDGAKRALKSHMWSSDFIEGEYERNRHDSLVMERLSASRYIPNIYSFCGTSQLVEYADKGNVHDLIKRMRQRRIQIPSLTRLKVAYQIASALRDLHSIDKGGVISVAHNDVCCHQIIHIDGTYKLNDFHLSKFLKTNRYTGETCLESQPYCMQKIFSPEQYKAKAEGGKIAPEKSDVYNMGNIFYTLLTLNWIYQGLEDADVRQRLMNGERSPYPARIKETTNAAEMALRDAVDMCWTHDPMQRPSSQDVADFIWSKLVDICDVDKDEECKVVVDIPDIEADYRYTDTDFWDNIFGKHVKDASL
mmetsp:Transcript_775/g.1634  ORF Transcript_775/g.1634 Transcript_775/m.1634 type:complete len:518 (-) Transcript_775:14-1567(-)